MSAIFAAQVAEGLLKEAQKLIGFHQGVRFLKTLSNPLT
jgi:hypothetical protein